METPASDIRRNGHAVPFRNLAIGATFECNGNVWTKRSTRTAAGIWPAVLPRWAYFGQGDRVYTQEGAE